MTSTLAPETSTTTDEAAGSGPEEGTIVGEGTTFQTDQLGLTVSLTAPQQMRVVSSRPGEVGLQGGCDGLRDLNTPECSRVLFLRRLARWDPSPSSDPYDVDSWLDANDGVVLLSSGDGTVAGRSARIVEVTVDPEHPGGVNPRGCYPGFFDPCLHFGVTAPPGPRTEWLSAVRVTKFFVVTVEDHEPLLVEVGATPDSDWFATVDTVVIPSLELGTDAPAPGG